MSKNSKGGVFVSKKNKKKNKKNNSETKVKASEELVNTEKDFDAEAFEITDTPDTHEEFVDFILDEATVVTIDEPFEPAFVEEAAVAEEGIKEKEAEDTRSLEDFVMIGAPDVDIPYSETFTEEDFASSVRELTPDDISPAPEEKQKKKKRKLNPVENIIQIGLLCVCAGVAVVCLGLLANNIWGKIKGQELYSNTEFDGFIIGEEVDYSSMRNLANIGNNSPLLSLFDKINAGDSAIEEDNSGKYSEQLSQMKASLSALRAQNEDIYGWIYAENTNINHPIVKGKDNDYYLEHAYTGEYLPIGAIFADYTLEDTVTDNFNLVLYGHNVVSTGQSSMFHDVEKFLDEEFFKANKIYIYTMDGAFIYQPVSIYDTKANYFYFRTIFYTENEFLGFAKEMVGNSRFYTGAVFGTGDKMLTLSTCTNGAADGRYSLHAKLIEVIK